MSAVVIGRFTPEQSEAIRSALSRAGMERRAVEDGDRARHVLSDPSMPPPHLVLVDAAMIELEPLMAWIRGQGRLFGAMVVAVVPAPSDHAFSEVVAAGCDDVVLQGDLGALTRRAAVLHDYDATARPPATQGKAIVAHPSVHRRRVLGRTLRLAGFDVAFAEREEEVERHCEDDATPALVVAAESLPPSGGLRAVIAARQTSGQASLPSVVVGTERELREMGPTDELNRVAVVDEQAPPDNLLFVANELLRPGVRNLRASQRVLWDALCAFRPAGQLHPVLGLTYNLSREGLYVRTLDPPPRGSDLWFELRPPESGEAVHLRGTVVWVRSVQNGPGGAAPPGFGVRIDAEACPPADLARYRECYEGLLEVPRLVA
ncbi:MAG TPA: PilZ domain-containing protein [Sandaracinaceae bacterium LLY-WYZ-13_1]|nr:PilZ domain-containing protein [Sandaracinaceae bacterium LLY-WYZ-13_1]